MKGNIAASLRDIVSGCSPLFLHCCYKKYKSTTCYRTFNNNFKMLHLNAN